MKPKIEFTKEYPTRGGGTAVVHFINKDGSMIGRYRPKDEPKWFSMTWLSDGVCYRGRESLGDIILPRVVMVPVEVPVNAQSVYHKVDMADDVQIIFYPNAPGGIRISIDDWIAGLEASDE